MAEIKVDYNELSTAIRELQDLESGTGYSLYSTAYFINHSRGKMYQKTNELYAKLMEIEDALIEVIKNTKEAFINAGVEFEAMEKKLATTYGTDIVSTIKKS